MPLPTFIIAGAQKCGTSTLSRLISFHPEAHVFEKKETHYFDWYFQRGIDWYRGLFKPRPGQDVIGEATPTYMHYPLARDRMIETLPDARIVVIMRQPVERAYSHYWHSRKYGFEDVETFEEAVAREPERLATGLRKELIRHSYLDRGRYIEQIEALEAGYPRERIYTLTLDDLITDRQAALEGVLDFIGVTATHAGVLIGEFEAQRTDDGDEERRENVNTYPELSPETRARLAEEFRPYNDRLAAWMGRDLSDWNTI